MAVAAHIRFAATAHADQFLATMAIPDLVTLYDALASAAGAFLDEMNRPRCRAAVAVLIEDEWERCNMLGELIYEEVRRRKPQDANEIAIRLRLLVSRNLGSIEKPLDLVELVHSLHAIEIH